MSRRFGEPQGGHAVWGSEHRRGVCRRQGGSEVPVETGVSQVRADSWDHGG